jgi:hypothetical protein
MCHGGSKQARDDRGCQYLFAAHGFSVVPRAAVPTAVQASEELQGACPDTATVMRLEVAQ